MDPQPIFLEKTYHTIPLDFQPITVWNDRLRIQLELGAISLCSFPYDDCMAKNIGAH